jgi:hypothetical protein
MYFNHAKSFSKNKRLGNTVLDRGSNFKIFKPFLAIIELKVLLVWQSKTSIQDEESSLNVKVSCLDKQKKHFSKQMVTQLIDSCTFAIVTFPMYGAKSGG